MDLDTYLLIEQSVEGCLNGVWLKVLRRSLMVKNLESIITDLKKLTPDEAYQLKEDGITIRKIEDGCYQVEFILPLFGKPAWEMDVEGCEPTPQMIEEICQLAIKLKNRLNRTATTLKLSLEKDWNGMGELYDITVYKQAETPENTILLCDEAREILTKHE